MNIYSDIRAYVREAIREIDAKYKEHNQAHTPDDVGAFDWDKVFYVRFLPVLGQAFSGAQGLQIPIDVEFGKKSGARPIEAHDDVMCNATELAFKLIDPVRFSDKFSQVSFSSITPTPVEANERWTKITLSVTINVSYKVR